MNWEKVDADVVKNDLLTQEGDAYRVYDYFFREWLRLMY